MAPNAGVYNTALRENKAGSWGLPAVSLADARNRRDDARRLIAAGN